MNIKISFVWMILVIVHAKAADYVFSLKQSPNTALIGSALKIEFITTFSMVSCTWIKKGPTQRTNLAFLCYFWHKNLLKLTTSRNVHYVDIYGICLVKLILL